MASQLIQTSAFQGQSPQLGVDQKTCPSCGQDIPPDKLEEIGGKIAARVREHTTAITAQVEKQYAAERARADARAKADLESNATFLSSFNLHNA